jgi:uncharacterized protein (TIGR02145 family)
MNYKPTIMIMRKFYMTTVLLLLSFCCFAQVPPMFNYQAVLRNENGQPLVSQQVDLRVAILQLNDQGTEVFSETHLVETNEFGLVNIKVGSINSLSGIQWAGEDYFLEVRINGQLMGASQLLSVPFALHAMSSADAFSGNYNDLINTPDLGNFILIDQPQPGDLLYYSEDQWQKLPIGEEGQVLGVKSGSPQWVFTDQTIDSVIDSDGNVYFTVKIGNQLWMKSNLRTSKFSDGTPITTGLDNEQWSTAGYPAYAVYPHADVTGIGSEQEMVEIYGKLYNWHAVNDPKALCPAGWRIATRSDYDELVMYVAYWGKDENYTAEQMRDNSIAGNFLKTCRQVNSPLGGECNTNDHPRFDSHNNHHGLNSFNFDGLPAGRRLPNGTFSNIGNRGYWWTSTALSHAMAYWRALWHDGGFAYSGFEYYSQGLSVRCILIEE